MAINYVTLKSEIINDPTGLGLSALAASGQDGSIAEVLNLVRGTITIRKSHIRSKDVLEAIAVSDYASLPSNPSAAQLSEERRYLAWFTGFLSIPEIRLLNDDGSNTPVATNLLAMFPVGTETRTRLIALASRNGSRAEQLFGRDTIITTNDVSLALRGV